MITITITAASVLIAAFAVGVAIVQHAKAQNEISNGRMIQAERDRWRYKCEQHEQLSNQFRDELHAVRRELQRVTQRRGTNGRFIKKP